MDRHSSRNTNDGRITAHIDVIRRPLGSLMDHIRRPVEGTSTRSYLNYATVRTENNISGVLELGGRVQAVRLEEPKHIKTTASQYSGSKVVHSVNPRDEDLSRILECPVCYAIPESEVFNCEKGHSVCGKCRVRLYQCALCASAFNGSRNFLVESLISYLKKVGFSVERAKPSASTNSEILVSCTYKSEGCRRRLPRSESEDHTSVCEFRPVICIAGGPSPTTKCSTTPKLSDYFNHLRMKHNIVGVSDLSGIFMKTDRLFMGFEIHTNWPPYYLQYDGKIFLRNAVLKNRRISWWIQLIGPDSESRKYIATVSLQSPKNSNFRISWTTPVFAIRCDEGTIDRSNIATISTEQILPFCSLNEQYGGRLVTHAWNCQIVLSRVN